MRRGAVKVLLGEQLAVDRHQNRPHPGQLGHARKRRLERRDSLDRGKGAGVDNRGPPGAAAPMPSNSTRQTQRVAYGGCRMIQAG